MRNWLDIPTHLIPAISTTSPLPKSKAISNFKIALGAIYSHILPTKLYVVVLYTNLLKNKTTDKTFIPFS